LDKIQRETRYAIDQIDSQVKREGNQLNYRLANRMEAQKELRMYLQEASPSVENESEDENIDVKKRLNDIFTAAMTGAAVGMNMVNDQKRSKKAQDEAITVEVDEDTTDGVKSLPMPELKPNIILKAEQIANKETAGFDTSNTAIVKQAKEVERLKRQRSVLEDDGMPVYNGGLNGKS